MQTDKSINIVNRGVVSLKQADQPDSDLVDAPPEVLLGFMWELTAEVYSLRGDFDAEQRLQRNVTNLIQP